MIVNKKIALPIAVIGASAALVLSACSSQDAASTSATTSATLQHSTGQLDAPVIVSANGTLESTLTAQESQIPYNGSTRWAMTYNGKVNGPTLRVRPGDKVTVHLINKLNEPTSLHTHGLHVSPKGKSDNPFAIVEPGQSYTYQYSIPVNQRAGTYWYHPHPHGLTAEQVSSGLSGAIIVEDNTDDALAKVSTDRVLVVTDPAIVQTNPVSSSSSSSSGGMGGMDMGNMNMGSSGVDMMTQMRGRTGPKLLTNGLDGVVLTGSNGKLERVHIVNATSSTRIRFTFTGDSMMQLATSGGRLQRAKKVSGIELAPGERSEVVLIPNSSGGELQAQRLSNEGNGGQTGAVELIAEVEASAGSDAATLPATLTSDKRDLFAKDVTVAKTRVITLIGHMNPTIDGKLFDPSMVNITAKKGTVEEWVIENTTPMRHPIHLHTWGLQVQGTQGWQDIVDVPAHSTAVVRVEFDDFTGKTVLHCHILDHEDTGMMAVIKVV